MKVSKEQMAKNRDRILTEAARLFREKGFEAVCVAEVMRAAGLTHGGFSGYFRSKDDLIAQAIDHPEGIMPLRGDPDASISGHLSAQHRDHPGHGCPIAAMCVQMGESAPEAGTAMAEKISAQIDSLMKASPEKDPAERRRSAIGTFSAMAGALILARSIEDPDLSEDLLRETRALIAQVRRLS